MSALEARDLAIGYRRRKVLDHLDLTLETGELVCLLGPNGTGKSTLLQTLGGMLPALEGDILIDGSAIAAMSAAERARRLATVLTEKVEVGSLLARQLVELGRYPHTNWSGLLGVHDRRVVDRAIGMVDAAHLAERDVNELSDGERQRLMIARALAQEPKVLLLDEPSAFLDVSARVEIMAMLRQLARENSVAVIVSSHDLEQSLRFADTIWLINETGECHTGAPEDLLADGTIGQTFATDRVDFESRDRSFHLRRWPQALASLDGTPEKRALAESVLRREGFGVVEAREQPSLSISLLDAGWTADMSGVRGQGATFGDLARFLRKGNRQATK
ncbi:ABC transporter ATP-binding protein [Devosia soli]|uniref:ABC transporter ATP-binding protein n=1 Tax=Devosia soli TaxID=361041 RepID=UPI00069A1768|nr:ABC transporter ATP-binding protein [Devosia soli]